MKNQKRPIDSSIGKSQKWLADNFVLIQKTRIKSWQGLFIIAFIAGALATLIWSIPSGYHQKSIAAGEEEVLLDTTFDGLDYFSIYKAKLDSTGMELLLEDPYREITHVNVSPNKQWLTFTRFNNIYDNDSSPLDGCATEYNLDYFNTEIMVMKTDGTGLKTLVEPDPDQMATNSIFDPNGNILFLYQESGMTQSVVKRLFLDTNMNITDEEILPIPSEYGGAPFYIAEPHQVGNIVSFPAYYINPELGLLYYSGIFKINNDGTNFGILTLPRLPGAQTPTINGSDHDQKISPNGSKMAFMRKIDYVNPSTPFHNWHIYTMNMSAPGSETDVSEVLNPMQINEADIIPHWIDNDYLLINHLIKPENEPINIGSLYTMRYDGQQKLQIPLPSGLNYRQADFLDGTINDGTIVLSAMKKNGQCDSSNEPPVFISEMNSEVTLAVPCSETPDTIEASDPDSGGTVTITVENKPDWLNIVNTQTGNPASMDVNFSLDESDMGDYTFTIVATDNRGARTEFEMTVHLVAVGQTPEQPAITNISSVGDNYVINWEKVENATHYRLYEVGPWDGVVEDDPWNVIAEISGDQATQYTATNRKEGLYLYMVMAFNGAPDSGGLSSQYNIENSTVYSYVIDTSPLAVPSIEIANEPGTTNVAISWPDYSTSTYEPLYLVLAYGPVGSSNPVNISKFTSINSFNIDLPSEGVYAFFVRTYKGLNEMFGIENNFGTPIVSDFGEVIYSKILDEVPPNVPTVNIGSTQGKTYEISYSDVSTPDMQPIYLVKTENSEGVSYQWHYTRQNFNYEASIPGLHKISVQAWQAWPDYPDSEIVASDWGSVEFNNGGTVAVCGNGVCEEEEQQGCLQDCTTIQFFIATDGNDSNPGTINAPFATLEKARDAVRNLKTNGLFNKSVDIILREGVYELNEAFMLTPEDSGTQNKPITYKAFPTEKVSISGGRTLNANWQPYNNNIYVADVSNFVSQYGDFNSLFVDGERATRARTPNEGEYFNMKDVNKDRNQEAFYFNEGDINPNWHNLTDIEVISLRKWTASRKKIKNIIGNEAYFEEGVYLDYDDSSDRRYYVENVFEGLDSPGEWYLDKVNKKLYYYPESNINLNTFIIPVIYEMVKFDNPIENCDMNIGTNNDLSISVWFKHPEADATAWRDSIVEKTVLDQPRQTYSLFMRGIKDMDNGHPERVNKIWFMVGNGSNLGNTLMSKETYNDDQWHHLVVTLDRDKGSCMYIDGELDNCIKDNTSNWNNDNDEPLVVGGSRKMLDEYWNGELDEFKTYKRVLSEDEIKELYQFEEIEDDRLMLSYSFDGNLTANTAGCNKNAFLAKKDTLGVPEFSEGIKGQSLVFSGSNHLIQLQDLDKFIHDINFSGLIFEYTDWTMPVKGYPGSNGAHRLEEYWSAIYVFGAKDIDFVNCTVQHTGSYALGFGFSENINIDNNELFDLGAGGIKVGDYISGRWNNIFRDYVTSNFNITNNRIHDYGNIYKDGNGVWILFYPDNTISHNLVYNSPQVGINLGWGIWGSGKTYSENNVIEYNEVHHVAQELNEAEAIHTLGPQPGSKIINNYIHDVIFTPLHHHTSHIKGICLDQGSTGILVKNNILNNVLSPLILNMPFDNIIQNNIFAEGEKHMVRVSGNNELDIYRNELPSGNSFINNIIYYNDPLIGNMMATTTKNTLTISNSDYNLYYNPNGGTTLDCGNGKDLGVENQKDNNWNVCAWSNFYNSDANSLVADPLFVDYENKDFRLQPNSPAFGLGFKQIDMSQVGPQGVECFDDSDCSSGNRCVQMKCQ